MISCSFMKMKKLILAIFLASAVTLLGSQLNMVLAQTAGGTSPLTSPITYYTYTLSGRIGYRLLTGLIPASFIDVGAKNLQSGEIFVTHTDGNGFYSLTVKQTSPSATYVGRPEDGKNTTWSPKQFRGDVSSDIGNLNFVGTGNSAPSTGIKLIF